MIPPIILTCTGRLFDLRCPEEHDYDIEEIAHALSRLCRYTGHPVGFYSVAQHSVLVSTLLPAEDALAGLLHDATEAYIGDVSAPLKSLLPEYRAIEARLEVALRTAFGLPTTLPPSVKHADQVLLVTEMRDLMPAHPALAALLPAVDPMPEPLIPWPIRIAQRAFLDRYAQVLQGQAVHP